MVKEKKIRMKCTVEIQFEGWGDRPYFKDMVKEAAKDLHYDVTSAGERRNGISGGAIVKIKKPSKLLKCEDIS